MKKEEIEYVNKYLASIKEENEDNKKEASSKSEEIDLDDDIREE